MNSRHDGDGGTAADAPAFLPEGAFVVQLKTGTSTAEASLAGRVEHVVSGQATHFQSPAELLAFLHEVLRPYVLQGQIREPRSLAGSRHGQTGGNP
jgi:hypothetical protein